LNDGVIQKSNDNVNNSYVKSVALMKVFVLTTSYLGKITQN